MFYELQTDKVYRLESEKQVDESESKIVELDESNEVADEHRDMETDGDLQNHKHGNREFYGKMWFYFYSRCYHVQLHCCKLRVFNWGSLGP